MSENQRYGTTPSPIWGQIVDGRLYEGDEPGASNVRGAVSARAKAADGDTTPESQQSILALELKHIQARRRRAIEPSPNPTADEGRPPQDLSGLALSGGGIRSATFCLGVVQALAQTGVIDRLDYLSTVSGGGYFGSSLITTMVETGGSFVFGKQQDARAATDPTHSPPAQDLRDTPAIGHLRNYSNYLVPNGAWDVFTGAAVVCRGLIANAVLILWFPFLAAAATVLFNPTRSALGVPKFLGYPLPGLGIQSFALTAITGCLIAALHLRWAISRSRKGPNDSLSDADGVAPRNHAIMLLVLAFIAFCEVQPLAIELIFGAAGSTKTGFGGVDLLTGLGVVFTPIMAIVTFLREPLKKYLEDSTSEARTRTYIGRFMAKAAIWAAALALPLLLWLFYLYLSYWGIDSGTPGADAFGHSAGWVDGLVSPFGGSHALAYFAVAVLLLVFSYPLTPNSNSLYHLYRDRLARAFQFKLEEDPARHGELARSSLSMHELAVLEVPYLLINTAINLQSSKEANRRGRNADFFIISPLFIGSRVTGYVSSKTYRGGDGLSLASAVAISGAAASSNMGAHTIRPLAPTLAMLNVRLGYWLENPIEVALKASGAATNAADSGQRTALMRHLRDSSHFYLFAEMFGVMNEADKRVYLTDGGHIENLAIYELLRRKCRTIIAVDAEADPEMRFPSLVTLQIYARIDLGIRIDIPLDTLRQTTLAAMAPQQAEKPCEPGPHVAIGSIDYGAGERGTLIYIKASLTGDENDYVLDYGRRNPSFPHESTGDQFFSEEQFEVYRALGFHAAHRFMTGEDSAMVAADGSHVVATVNETGNNLIKAARALLMPPDL